MKFSFFQTSKHLKAVAGNRFIFSLLTFALLLTATVFGWFIWHLYHSNRVQADIQERMMKMAEFQGLVIQLDEILTSSAEMSAKTGDLTWEARYGEFQPRLIEALRTTRNSAPNAEIGRSIVQIDETRRRLFELDRRAFDAVRKGQPEDARALLTSGEYKSLKELFNNGVGAFDTEIKEYEKSRLTEANQDNTRSVVVIIVIFAVSAWAWLAVIYSLQKSRKILLEYIAEKRQIGEALKQSEAQFRELFENANDIVFTTDLEGRFTSFNKEGEKLTGYSRDEIYKLKIGDIFASEHLESISRMQFEEIGRDASIKYEAEIITKTGGAVMVEINCRLIYKDDQPVGIQSIARDITVRREMQEVLKKSEQYHNLFKHANDAILIFEPENEIILNVNDKACELYGIKYEDFIGLSIKTFSKYKDDDEREAPKLLETGVYEEFETVQYRSDGTPLHLMVNASIVEYEGLRAVLSVNRDITRRKQVEEALRESEQHFRSVANSAQDAIVSADNHGKINFWNEGARKIFGYEREEAIGKSLGELMPERYRDAHQQGMRRYAQTGNSDVIGQIVELNGLRKDGSEFPLELSLGTWQTADGKFFTGIIRDITERKKAQELLQQNLSILASTFEATTDGVLVVDLDNNIVNFNKKFVEMWGIPEEIIETRDSARVIPFVSGQLKDPEEFIGKIKQAVENPQLTDFSVWELKDGRTYERFVQPQILNGEAVGRVLTYRDVTLRKTTEDALLRSQSALNATQDGVFMFSPDTLRFFYVNKGAIEQTGYSRLELLKMTPLDVRSDLTEKKFRRLLARLVSGKIDSYSLTSAFPRKDGTDIPVEIILQYVASETGEDLFVAMVRDITERKQAQDALQKNLSLLTSTFEATAEGILVVGLDNKIVTYNQKFIEFFHIPEDIISSRDNSKAADYVVNLLSNPEEFAENTKKFIANPETKSYDLLKFKNGKIYERYNHPQTTGGEVVGRVVSFRDITERKRAEEGLQESEYKLRMLLESMNEGLSQVSNDQTIEFVNDRFCEMTGYRREELLGRKTFEGLLDEEGARVVGEAEEQRKKGFSGQYELRLKKKSGEALWVIVGGAPIVNAEGVMTGTMGVFTDITERKLAEERLLHDALHDGLTGLANRTLFINHLQMAIERAKRSDQNLYAVLFLDFDRFKVINDSLGHAAGDSLLKQIARRLESSLRSGDLLARLGGDEFTILLNEMDDTNDALQVAERIKNDLNTPFMLGKQEVFISASIGIALCGAGHKRAEDMLRDADIAMYRAKAKGKAQHQVFDQAMHRYAINKLQLETEMHHALQRGEFSLNYQPIVNLETNSLIGFEALIRWNHPDRGMVLPSDFIPIAEENELVIPLGRWILYESCRQMREWQTNNPWASRLTISVNLSSKQFLQFDLYEQVAAALISTQLDPRALKLEITESHVMENSDKAVSVMHRLRDTGVEISLDDFGTGYSSLSYLHRLPVNYLKIDRSFVSRMVESKENGEIVHTIVKLAQNLKMKVIAEGIENFEQFSQLKHLGCEYGQGYFISAPLEVEAAARFINKRAEEPLLLLNQPIINAELNM